MWHLFGAIQVMVSGYIAGVYGFVTKTSAVKDEGDFKTHTENLVIML